MELKTNSQNGVTIVEISGSLDGTTAEKAMEQIEPLLTANSLLLFDMKDCDYVSSAGLRVLLMTAKQLKKVGGKGVFSGLCEEVKEVMDMTGFDNIFKSYSTISEAKEVLRKE